MVELEIESILDPRGRRIRNGVGLAPRVIIDALGRGPGLLYDKAKMSVGH